MRYVCDIQKTHRDGRVEHLKSSLGYLNYELTILVRDTETGEVEFLDPCECLDDECFGFASVALADTCAAACHDDKTALLYKYVVSAETVPERSQTLDNADSCTLKENCLIVNQGIGSTVLDIRLVNDSILIEGNSGSVVSRQYGWNGESKVTSLYDFLGYLCRMLGINVMKYETIQLYKAGKVCHTSTIKLLHTQEADRYFTKMYLDVVRR